MRHRWLPVLVALGCAVGVRAQDRPVLHEYVPSVGDDEEMSLVTGDSDEPAAIVYDGEVLPAPEGGDLRGDERPMTALPGDSTGREEVGRRSPTFRPDRITELEGTLGYYTVFSPSIAPFKRVTALDSVVLADDGRTPVLAIGDLTTTPVPVEGPNAPAPDDRPRDRFWGSVVVDFSGGRMVPLPSVSPESRILTLRTEPETGVRIEKDPADNFFVVLPEGASAGRVRVVFLTDAPQGYFNTPVPDVREDALAGEAPRLPVKVQERADQVAFRLGLSRGLPLHQVLDKLVEHFRSFEESDEPPEDTGDIYVDLALGMRGVCRHRAYAFVITALGLGIPARFVQNEAHAWVEVKMAGFGWMRIDLGGAAQGLQAHGGDDRPVYRPREPDPLPRPEAYERSYSQLRGDVSGLRRPGDDGPGGGSDSSSSSGTGAGGDDPGGEPGEPDPQGPDNGDPGSGSIGPAAAGPPGPMSDRMPLVVTVDTRRHTVFRGQPLDVNGRVVDPSGQGVPGMRVEVVLSGVRERLLGVTVSRDHGYFRGTFGVPPDVPVGDYQLLVRTPGDEHHAPATAR